MTDSETLSSKAVKKIKSKTRYKIAFCIFIFMIFYNWLWLDKGLFTSLYVGAVHGIVLALIFVYIVTPLALAYYRLGRKNWIINNSGIKDHVRGTQCFTADTFEHLLAARKNGMTGNAAIIHALKAKNGLANDDRGDMSDLLRFAGTHLPLGIENLHIAITASTGAGKSVALRGLLSEIRKRGDRAVIIDNGYEFYHQFAQENDLLLNSFDDNSQRWDLRNECEKDHHYDTIIKSVIPDAHGSEKSWNSMAAALLTNIAVSTGADNKTLLEIATSWSSKQLEPILAGTSSAVLLQEGGERLLTNIRSVFATYLKAWKYNQGGDFSLKNYILGDNPSWLWLPFKESELELSKQLIATWLDIIVQSGLERKEGQNPKTWIIIDELDTLGELNSLIQATTKLRKRNMPIVVAFQGYSQVESTYGEKRAQTLMSCFSTKLILRTGDHQLAKMMSAELGEVEKWDQTNLTKDAGKQKVTTALIMPESLAQLSPGEGFLKLPGDYPIIYVEIPLH